MSINYVNDLQVLLETDDESEKYRILSKLVKIAQNGVIFDPKHLIFSLLYSNEPIIECKILALLSFLVLKHTNFKQKLSKISVIYHYSLKGLSSGCARKIPKVLHLLTALSYQTEDYNCLRRRHHRESSTTNTSDSLVDNSEDDAAFRIGNWRNSDVADGSHMIAKEAIRTSGCLKQMCLLFIQINNKNAVWHTLCECLTESCSDVSDNQEHSSHILPKCLREMNTTARVEVINLVIALIRLNSQNCDRLLHLGGMHCIQRNLLHISEGVELLYVLLESSKLAQQQATRCKILDKLNVFISNNNTHSYNTRSSMRDLKLLHWITRTVFKFRSRNENVSDNVMEEAKDRNIQTNQEFTAPNVRTYSNEKTKTNKTKTKEGISVKKQQQKNEENQLIESFRSKYDAISSVNVTLNTSLRSVHDFKRVFSINGSSKKKSTPIKPKIKENINPEEVDFDNITLNYSNKFTPRYFSTPNDKKRPSSDINNDNRVTKMKKVKMPGKESNVRGKIDCDNDKVFKIKDAFGNSFAIHNPNLEYVNDNQTGIYASSSSFKVRQLVGQVIEHYRRNDNQGYENVDQNYKCFVNSEDFVTKKADYESNLALIDSNSTVNDKENRYGNIAVQNDTEVYFHIGHDDDIREDDKIKMVEEFVNLNNNFNEIENQNLYNPDTANNGYEYMDTMEIIKAIDCNKGIMQVTTDQDREIIGSDNQGRIDQNEKEIDEAKPDETFVYVESKNMSVHNQIKYSKKDNIKVNLVTRFDNASKKNDKDIENLVNNNNFFFDNNTKKQEKIFNFEDMFKRNSKHGQIDVKNIEEILNNNELDQIIVMDQGNNNNTEDPLYIEINKENSNVADKVINAENENVPNDLAGKIHNVEHDNASVDKTDRNCNVKYQNTTKEKNETNINETADNMDTQDVIKLASSANSDKTLSDRYSSADMNLDDHSTTNTCCRKKCRDLEKLIRQLKKGISVYGLNFQKISKTFWPDNDAITPQYLYQVFRTYIIQK